MSQTEAYNYPGFRHLFKVPDCTGADLLFRLSMRSPKTKCITLCRMAQIVGLAGIIDSVRAIPGILVRSRDIGFPAAGKAVERRIVGRSLHAHHADDRVEQIVMRGGRRRILFYAGRIEFGGIRIVW